MAIFDDKTCGVCIQLLEARIQKVEPTCQSATMQVVKNAALAALYSTK